MKIRPFAKNKFINLTRRQRKFLGLERATIAKWQGASEGQKIAAKSRRSTMNLFFASGIKLSLPFFTLLVLLTSCSHYSDTIAALKAKRPKSVKAKASLLKEEEEFIALREEDFQFSDFAAVQPKDIPGSSGSGIPSLELFRKAASDLAHIFQNVYFNTDDHVLRSTEYTHVLDKVAAYLRHHPKTYICVDGHCDERGSEAYNLALGTRRANFVRAALIQRGVDSTQIYSISYGKEQPLDPYHTSAAWSRNRRAEFRIFQKK